MGTHPIFESDFDCLTEMVDPGLISYCERQSRDGSPKSRRLAEASVCTLKLSKKLESVNGVSIESVILELFPGYLDQKNRTRKVQPDSRAFLTSTTIGKINLSKLTERQLKLVDLTISVSLQFLDEKRTYEALIAAQQYLVLIADIHGTSSIELIPAYLLIAEISLALNKLREAEQQMQQANWVVMQNQSEESSNHVKQKLYRLFGLLQAAKGDYTDATRLFAEQIVYASKTAGTESIGAASGYFNIAQVLNDKRTKVSLYIKTLECWLELIERIDDLNDGTPIDNYQQVVLLQELSIRFKELGLDTECEQATAITTKFIQSKKLGFQ